MGGGCQSARKCGTRRPPTWSADSCTVGRQRRQLLDPSPALCARPGQHPQRKPTCPLRASALLCTSTAWVWRAHGSSAMCQSCAVVRSWPASPVQVRNGSIPCLVEPGLAISSFQWETIHARWLLSSCCCFSIPIIHPYFMVRPVQLCPCPLAKAQPSQLPVSGP